MTRQPLDDNAPLENATQARFTATSWTNIMAAQQAGSAEAGAALEKLCATYWYPLYAYLRRKGNDPHRAQDLTQEFFYRLIKQNYLGAVDRKLGKFRSFLLAALNHFVSNKRDFERAAKRGGGQELISLDELEAETRFLREPELKLTPEKIFERNWFLTLFDQALAQLREEVAGAGREETFEQLKQFILEEPDPGEYETVAARVNLTPNALRVTVHRWRERYKKLLRDEILRTVADPSEIEDELNRFFATVER
jgi:DNA-directed RNA polymerase specialized sigma24 family protein